ncbi:Methyltransferase OS=Streptomyces glaucescens OX=1907 GN=SGLAU_22665 PE=4 SV=1 [Streptomyces glaucescens]
MSTTALHYLPPDALRRTYRRLAGLLRPGGVLVNGDHLPHDDAELARIADRVGSRHAERQRAWTGEDWTSWWTGVTEEPELADLLAERRSREPSPGAPEPAPLSLATHVRLLRRAGFRQAGAVWQYGDSHVVVAIR